MAREQAVANAQTALDVASSANKARAAALDDREAEVAKRSGVCGQGEGERGEDRRREGLTRLRAATMG